MPASEAVAPTLLGDDGAPTEVPVAETVVAAGPKASIPSASVGSSRITVLPHIEGDGAAVQIVHESRTRYEPMKLLGAGGMGEVVLVQDHDIARPVALKRLLPDLVDPVLLARFVDEIRTVGRLEHPNIVPIHDVGVDELGRYFFVMKYVAGETLEAIVKKLAAGDAEAHARYSFEQRIEVFLGLLHALEYAHEHGVIHRDIKPANVMVGRFGEVVLMDWGIAKPAAAARDPAAHQKGELASSGPSSAKRATHATRVGAIIGTPAYMSPEQARGDNQRIDIRSDLYSATVLFHELVSLRHYLDDKDSMEATLGAVIGEPFGFRRLASLTHPLQPSVPGELLHFIAKGLSKAPEARFQSAKEMVDVLQSILEGKVRIQCHVTLTKRTFRELGRLVDARPNLAFMTLIGLASAVIFAVVHAVRAAL